MKKRNSETEINNKIDVDETYDEAAEAEALREKKLRRRKRQRVWDRIAGFIIISGIIIGCACLTLEYIIVKGPSPALRDIFISTMDETRRFKFIPKIFLTEDELKEISVKEMDKNITTDTSLITIQAGEAAQTDDGEDAYGLVDDDGDGVIFTDIKGNGFVGYMITVLDPSRVFVGMPDSYGGVGLKLDELVSKYGAAGGINAGGFKDDGGGGFGGIPEGITVINGEIYNGGDGSADGFAGFDKDGILHVGYFEYDDIIDKEIVNGVSFGPILISNGEPTPSEYLSSGVNPRTAIAQRADGAVIMLVIDGRQLHSIGAKYQDVIDILMDYGAVNACNMDGGSSTVMYYEGRYVNSCSAENGQPRPLPDAFMFK